MNGKFMKCLRMVCMRFELRAVQPNCYHNYVTLTINETVELAKRNVNAIS